MCDIYVKTICVSSLHDRVLFDNTSDKKFSVRSEVRLSNYIAHYTSGDLAPERYRPMGAHCNVNLRDELNSKLHIVPVR